MNHNLGCHALSSELPTTTLAFGIDAKHLQRPLVIVGMDEPTW
jgi:hypothetical protein